MVRWFEWAVDDTISEQAWHRTELFDEDIDFQSSTWNEGEEGYEDWHTFYLRAVDDQYARSVSAKPFFNAHTIAPTSRIVRPTPEVDAKWAKLVRISWAGEDLDATNPEKRPVAYEI